MCVSVQCSCLVVPNSLVAMKSDNTGPCNTQQGSFTLAQKPYYQQAIQHAVLVNDKLKPIHGLRPVASQNT